MLINLKETSPEGQASLLELYESKKKVEALIVTLDHTMLIITEQHGDGLYIVHDMQATKETNDYPKGLSITPCLVSITHKISSDFPYAQGLVELTETSATKKIIDSKAL